MCDCIKMIDEKLKEAFQKEVGTTEYHVDVQLENKALMLESGDIQLHGISEVSYKKGKQNKKWKKCISFRFCPFCGVEYPANVKP